MESLAIPLSDVLTTTSPGSTTTLTPCPGLPSGLVTSTCKGTSHKSNIWTGDDPHKQYLWCHKIWSSSTFKMRFPIAGKGGNEQCATKIKSISISRRSVTGECVMVMVFPCSSRSHFRCGCVSLSFGNKKYIFFVYLHSGSQKPNRKPAQSFTSGVWSVFWRTVASKGIPGLKYFGVLLKVSV